MGMPYARQIDDYIKGGEGNPEELLAGLGYWLIWDTEEIRDLITWLRAYNEDPANKQKVTFFGCDPEFPADSVTEILDYLHKVDPEEAATLKEKQLVLDMAIYMQMSEEDRAELAIDVEALSAAVAKNKDEYIAVSGFDEYEWAHRMAEVAKQAIALFEEQIAQPQTFIVREDGMEANIRWVLDVAKPDEKVIIWAHNLHIARDILDAHMSGRPPEENLDLMSFHLGRYLGDEMVSIGMTFNTADGEMLPEGAAPKGTMNDTFAQVGLKNFMVDLRTAPESGPTAEWLNGQQSVVIDMDGRARFAPGKCFDILVYTDTVHRAAMSKSAQEKFKAMQSEF
jgi:erythromycin esterase